MCRGVLGYVTMMCLDVLGYEIMCRGALGYQGILRDVKVMCLDVLGYVTKRLDIFIYVIMCRGVLRDVKVMCLDLDLFIYVYVPMVCTPGTNYHTPNTNYTPNQTCTTLR